MSSEHPLAPRLPVGMVGGLPLPASTPLTAQEQQIHDDYEWCLHDPEVRRAHGGKVVAVHQRHVWGAGADHAEALRTAMANPGCPLRETLAFVVVPEEPTQVAEGAD